MYDRIHGTAQDPAIPSSIYRLEQTNEPASSHMHGTPYVLYLVFLFGNISFKVSSTRQVIIIFTAEQSCQVTGNVVIVTCALTLPSKDASHEPLYTPTFIPLTDLAQGHLRGIVVYA